MLQRARAALGLVPSGQGAKLLRNKITQPNRKVVDLDRARQEL
jgi:hypothetical protein